MLNIIHIIFMVNLGYAAFFEAGTKKIMLHTHVWQKKVAKFYQFSQVFRQSWSTYKPRSPESNSRFTSRISCALIYLHVVSRCRHPQQSRALNLEMNQFCFVFSLPARDFPKLMRSCQKIPARTRSRVGWTRASQNSKFAGGESSLYQLPKTVSLVCHDLERQGHQTRPNKHMLMFTNHITQKAKLHLDSQYENLPIVF